MISDFYKNNKQKEKIEAAKYRTFLLSSVCVIMVLSHGQATIEAS